MWTDHLTEIIIATTLFGVVSAVGFVAARWRRVGHPQSRGRERGRGQRQVRRRARLGVFGTNRRPPPTP